MKVHDPVTRRMARCAAWAALVLAVATTALVALPTVAEAGPCDNWRFSLRTCERIHHGPWFPIAAAGVMTSATLLALTIFRQFGYTEDEAEEQARLFTDVATRVGVDPKLLAAIAAVTSGMDQQKVGAMGAVGMMQLTPATAQALGVDPHDRAQNVLGGAKYLKMLLDRFNGNLDMALAAYDAGPGNVERYGRVPPFRETERFVEAVKRRLEEQGPAPR